MSKVSLFQKLRNTVVLSMMITLPFALGGCAGMLVDSLGHADATEGSYSEMVHKIPPLQNGYGRLFVYRTSKSTHSRLQYGIGIKKNSAAFTVDNDVHELIWESFKYFDLLEGKHELTCGKDVIKSVKFFGGHNYQKGSNSLNIDIYDGATIFVRLDYTKEKPNYKFVIVEQSQAVEEISGLPYQNEYFEYKSKSIVE